MNNYYKLFEEYSNLIDSFNKKITDGQRLNDSDSASLSKATRIYPLLEKYIQLENDLAFAQDNSSDFDADFKKDLEEKVQATIIQIEAVQKEYDHDDINEFILEMRAGAGGDEASLFCRDLFNAYTKYFTSINANWEILDQAETDSSGFSSIVAQVKSTKAYNIMKFEGGVHRVQRIPKTENSGRVHTSTISVAILPIMEHKEVIIKPQDIRVDVYRSGGHGGQSVNTTDSAVRITHLPSGIVVTCQNTKSQIKNKEMAMKVLEARLNELERNSASENIQNIRNTQILNSDRSEKIRTYNFLQDRITDHRAKVDSSNISKFLQGDIEPTLLKVVTALERA